MRALKYSSSDVLKLLLESPSLDINIQTESRKAPYVNLRHRRGQTAFHFVVWWARIDLVEALLSNGGDPYACDDSGCSPWDWAFQYDRPAMKAVFSREEEYVRPMYAHSDAPALHQAVPHGSVDAVKLLLGRKGLDPAVIDSDGATALHLAVRSRPLGVVDLILRHPRVDVNCIDNDGKSPLWWSTFLLYYDITERLLAEEDIDANLIGGFGRLDTPSAPLHHAATRSHIMILKQLLATPGIDLNICAARQAHFSAAAAAGRVSTMRMLMSQRGVEINTIRILMDPPLCQAAAGGRLEAVRLLPMGNLTSTFWIPPLFLNIFSSKCSGKNTA
ncbi:unnamed protein product [Penicillium pancosmium]